ncbi:HK97 gp10 family phage protein [Clostridium sp. HMP27]|uniref:HK97 gp10 family phage protein n=1 Tax=Clostridium sp. HMP27 TaxID=1487921 RepID=UPI00052B63BE|nr:HK97 gp10 family phage protein [Clostridium sp. HMP27]KGK88037.1 phage portal protein [Clostridium sp. HMP27]
MAKDFEINTKELDKFFKKFQKVASKEFKKEVATWLEAMGFEFLDIIQNEIIATKTVDTRLLLNSFDKGNGNNIWKISNGGLTIEIGTNVEYAQAVNDGHFTTKDGVASRWVPGRWVGDKFIYDASERKTGMLLKRKFVDGTKYWDRAIKIYEKIFHKSLEKNLQGWLDKF